MNTVRAAGLGDGAAPLARWRAADGLHYGLLGLPLAFCLLPLYVLMPNLYASQWGVPLGALGAVLLGARLIDALIDPLLGRVCDRAFAHSLGAVWTLGGCAAALLALGFALLFAPPAIGPAALLWWAAGCLALTYPAASLLTVAHQAWGAMLGGDALYRSRVVAWREGWGLLGVLLAAATPALLGLPALVVLLCLGLLLGWFAWLRAPRPAPRSQDALAQVPPGVLWLPWRHRAFRRLLLVFMLNGIASAIPATLLLFFMQDRLQASAALQSAALLVYFGCGALSMPLWLRCVARQGLVRSWRLGMLLSIAVFLGASALGAGDGAWFLLVCALSGLALGSDLAIPGALLAGAIEQAGQRGRAEGAYFGWWHFASKLNLALAAGLALPLLAWLGYVPGTRDAQATAVLSAAYCLLPCALKAMACGALRLLPTSPSAQPHTP